ncbi:MAG: hypothetical protein FJ398_12665 [Verrucomicrobia bacterium]|nr:hypothetical protein [Verrucomicrobiota bacterium]
MSTAEAPTVLDSLRRILRHHFGLSEACGVASLFLPGDVASSDARPAGAPPSPRRFLLRTESAPVHLRVAERLDLVADAVICDSLLGTLGLIHLFRPPQLTGAEAKKAGVSKSGGPAGGGAKPGCSASQ